MSAIPVCMHNPGHSEYSLCGDAFDAFDSGDKDEPIIIGKSGDRITCEQCLSIIATCKSIKDRRIP